MHNRLLVLLASVAVALLFGAGPAVATGSPVSTPAAPTIQITVPGNNSGFGIKDLLVPLGALVGAALGFGGAITAARLAAQAQDRRARQEQEHKRFEEDRGRRVRRIESFAEQADAAIRSVIELTRFGDRNWHEPDAVAARLALRLNAAQLIGASRLLAVPGLDGSVGQFVTAALAVSSASSATSAGPLIESCGGAYDDLLKTVGDGLTDATAATA